jgi:hypothetical protein
MRRHSIVAESPDAYVASLSGWRGRYAVALRSAVLEAAPLREVIKWGHLVYLSYGPVLLIRAEERRLLLGFWRGQRLLTIEPRLEPGGKYEMATLELLESTPVKRAIVLQLVETAVAFNISHGDPADLSVSKFPQ